jgi:hypothetical protein
VTVSESPITALIRDTFRLSGPPPTPPPTLTLVDRLDLITDGITDVQSSADANGQTLEDLAGAVETNGNTLTDILAVLEDIRDLLSAAADKETPDD